MSRFVPGALALFLLLHMPAPSTAQLPRSSLSQPTDSSMAIVPFRSLEEIESDASLVAGLVERATLEADRAKTARENSDRYVELTQDEIDLVEDQIDVADDNDREAEKEALEAERDALRELKRFYERERELHEAEEELAKARAERARAALKAFDMEGELATQRARLAASGVGARGGRILSDLEKRTLEAQKDLYDRDGRVADREKSVIERRLDLFEARERLLANN